MKVLCVSGSRADLGGISAVYEAFKHKGIESHLLTEADGKNHQDPQRKIYDIAVLLGDRFEILRFATELYIGNIPIAHLSGGDITEGSKDDSMRHAITKLASLHFPSNEDSAKRIIQMGEEPWRVKVVGYPGMDSPLTQVAPFEKTKEVVRLINDDFILVVWHPNTLAPDKNYYEVTRLTKALTAVNRYCVVIGPNNDQGHQIIRDHLSVWAGREGHTYRYDLDRSIYLSLLQKCLCLVGNSSSGIYEAPSYNTPVINIGDRQKGRIKPSNVRDVSINAIEIREAVWSALLNRGARVNVINPYERSNAAYDIVETVTKYGKDILLSKKFCEVSLNKPLTWKERLTKLSPKILGR